MEDLISVIVPIYKVEKYLSKCVESIIAQTYINLEIILVDDGSPDECGKICDVFASKDSRIKVVHKENGGLSDARNAGIKSAHGEYLLFVDSDDYIAPNMVELLYKSVVENKSDMALCSLLPVDEFGNIIKDNYSISPIKTEILNSEEALCCLYNGHNSWYYVVACNKLYKKTLFDSIEFPKGKLHEDEYIVHKIFDKCKTISCLSDSLYYYVQRKDSIMGQEMDARHLDMIEACIERVSFFICKDNKKLIAKAYDHLISNALVMYFKMDIKNKENLTRFNQLKRKINKMYVNNLCMFVRHLNMKLKIKFFCFVFLFQLYIGVIKIKIHILNH